MSTSYKRARTTPTSIPLDDAPRLVPHAGLPGVDGTTRFCYGFVTAGGAGASSAAWARSGAAPLAAPATTHVDGTARVQVVRRDVNPLF